MTDPAKFHETFTRGIGSAKAFGFGLLVIAPASWARSALWSAAVELPPSTTPQPRR